MDKETVSRFKLALELEKSRIVGSVQSVIEELTEKTVATTGDEGDQAQNMAEQHLAFRFKERERLLLRKIEQALDRIKAGIFGECEDCGEDIDIRRLNARPTATLCLICKEAEEKKEREFSGEAL